MLGDAENITIAQEIVRLFFYQKDEWTVKISTIITPD